MPRTQRDVQAEATKAIRTIEEWAVEISNDQDIDVDTCYSDVVHAYLDTEVGESDPPLRRAILQGTGVGERR